MVEDIVSSRVSGTPGRGTPGQAYLQAGHPGTGRTKTMFFRKYIVCPPQAPKNHISRSTNKFRCVFCIQNKNILDFVIGCFQNAFKMLQSAFGMLQNSFNMLSKGYQNAISMAPKCFQNAPNGATSLVALVGVGT